MNNKMGFLSVYSTLCILLTGFVASVKGQCDGSTQILSDQNKEISSPNYNDGGEYSKSANCSWEFSPRSDVKDYALVLTVKQMRLYAVKSGRKHCLGSYSLSINEEQTNCLRYAGRDGPDDSTSYDFCNAFYSSPTCAKISQSQGCEKTLQTPYPVSVTYYSDGRTDLDVASAAMYFKIGYEFIACPTASPTPASSAPASLTTASSTPASETPASETTASETTVATSTKNKRSTVPEMKQTKPTDNTLQAGYTIEGGHSTSSAVGKDPAGFSASTIVIIVLVAVIVALVIGGIVGGIYVCKRLKTAEAGGRNQRQQPPDVALSRMEDEVYQESSATPDVVFHNYEEIQSPSVSPPGLIETPGYEVPQPSEMPQEEAGYVVFPSPSMENLRVKGCMQKYSNI